MGILQHIKLALCAEDPLHQHHCIKILDCNIISFVSIILRAHTLQCPTVHLIMYKSQLQPYIRRLASSDRRDTSALNSNTTAMISATATQQNFLQLASIAFLCKQQLSARATQVKKHHSHFNDMGLLYLSTS